MRKEKDYIFRAKVLNPVVLIIYGVACFYIYSLLQYGGVRRKVPIILVCTLVLLFWLIFCFYRNHKHKKHLRIKQEDLGQTKEDFQDNNKIKISKYWYFISCLLLLTITITTGAKVYQSGTNLQGKLSWVLRDLKNKRQINLVHDNIYDNGIEGIFEDIQEKITLPDELYIGSSTEFQVKFNKEGKITYLYGFLYGKDQDEEIQSFLINYNRKKDKKIIVYLNGHVNADLDDRYKLQPLRDLMQEIPLEETVVTWNQETYGILYTGYRNWGYNTDGIVYIDENGDTQQPGPPMEEITGYTVSVYVPGMEDSLTPARFIHEYPRVYFEDEDEEADNSWDIGYNYNEGEETFFLNENLGYQLSVTDAALGSRFYALFQTQDGGNSWETLNADPYLGNTGVSAGITFINEELGFIGLSHSGGYYGELYRTEDGGISFEEITFPDIQVDLNETETYNPFDYPDMPYEENGELFILLGQGQDGDHNGGSKALYQSEDNGETWEYIREVR